MEKNNPLLSPVILLAGGKSSRMGIPKGLLDYFGRPWIAEQLLRLKRAGARDILCVLGYSADLYLDRVPELQEVETSFNPHPELGTFSSIQTGLAHLKGSGPAYILPLDVPAAQPDTWQKLDRALSPKNQVILPHHQSKGGHPVLLSASFQKTLLEISPESPEARLDLQIRALHSSQVARIEVDDEEVLLNLNTPVLWGNFLQKSSVGSTPHFCKSLQKVLK